MLCIALWIWSVILPWILLGTVTTIIVGILLLMYPAWDSKKKDSNGRPNKPRHEKWFYVWLIGLSALGGFWALFLPLALNQKFDGPNADGNQLRLHLLYITGGVLALTTLGETHRKNNLEKHKNDQDHTRQVHAERRNRYTTAIEQLSSDKASIRLGGVYTLVGLVDEWLSDEKAIPNIEERRKEGQVIINNLCAYVRSPFDLAESYYELTLSYEEYGEKFKNNPDNAQPLKSYKDFMNEKAHFYGEKEVRIAILDEIRNRLNGGITTNDGKKEVQPGTWSGFNYDFSKVIFFYDVDLRLAKFTHSTSFKDAKFIGEAIFNGAYFVDANFVGATFSHNTSFSYVKFTGETSFDRAKFTGAVGFFGTQFTGETYFGGATFTCNAAFIAVKFTYEAYFGGVTFTSETHFSTVTLTSTIKFDNSRFIYGMKNTFSVAEDSSIIIDTKEHCSPDGTVTIIPKNCIVFNPLLTKISISDDSIKGISIKSVSANGVLQIQEKLAMSPWPKKSESNTKH